MIGKNAVWMGYYKRKRRYWFVVWLLLLLVLVFACIMMIYGKTIYTPREIFEVLKGNETKGAAFTIKSLRLPRMLAAILCGSAFGLAGNIFQKLLGNPLASPDIIGVTSGASVAAVFGILVLKWNENVVSVMAVLSGLFVSTLIYFLAQRGGFSSGKLILTGIGTQAFLNAVISWMLLKASEYDVSSALRWLSGSLNGVSLDQISRLFVALVISAAAMFFLRRYLEILQLGEASARALGVRGGSVKLGLILSALLLIAVATSVTGPIASVAFLSGPIAARISGTGRNNLITSALTGSLLVMISDMIGQYGFSSRYPVGVVTGILGAPYLIWLLIRMNGTHG